MNSAIAEVNKLLLTTKLYSSRLELKLALIYLRWGLFNAYELIGDGVAIPSRYAKEDNIWLNLSRSSKKAQWPLYWNGTSFEFLISLFVSSAWVNGTTLS